MIYEYKTEGKSPIDVRNYQNLIELFKSLKDGNINPIEVSKSQSNFKSDLVKIKKKKYKIKIRRSIKCNKK